MYRGHEHEKRSSLCRDNLPHNVCSAPNDVANTRTHAFHMRSTHKHTHTHAQARAHRDCSDTPPVWWWLWRSSLNVSNSGRTAHRLATPRDKCGQVSVRSVLLDEMVGWVSRERTKHRRLVLPQQMLNGNWRESFETESESESFYVQVVTVNCRK